MTDPTATPTLTEPHHDVREEWAARLQAADVGVDFPWLTEDGCDVWHEQSEATQEHYRRLLDLALSAGLQIPPAAAAPDERELVGHLDRFIADCAAEGVEKGVLSVEWAGRLRAALAARPAPTEPLVGRGGLTGAEFVITAWHIEDGRVVADEKVTADEYAAQHRPAPAVSAPYPRAEAEVLRATANDLGDWLGSSDLMADEISDHGIDVILRWLRERAGQVEREGGEE